MCMTKGGSPLNLLSQKGLVFTGNLLSTVRVTWSLALTQCTAFTINSMEKGISFPFPLLAF